MNPSSEQWAPVPPPPPKDTMSLNVDATTHAHLDPATPVLLSGIGSVSAGHVAVSANLEGVKTKRAPKKPGGSTSTTARGGNAKKRPSTNTTPFQDPLHVKLSKVEIRKDWTTLVYPPTPRHGHRAVVYDKKMIIFGGGNRGLFDGVHVFDLRENKWLPKVWPRGEIPSARAACGMVLDNNRVIIHGGMTERVELSDELYEFYIPTLTWRKLSPSTAVDVKAPSARLGHSLTVIQDRAFLFGGLTLKDYCFQMHSPMPSYFNDFYVLQLRGNRNNGTWEVPPAFGRVPSPRESHSAVAYSLYNGTYNRLVVFGGMNGDLRLGDIHLLDVDTWMWTQPTMGGIPPSPRSLHSANLVGNRMFVFGGWSFVPGHWRGENYHHPSADGSLYSNELFCLNLDTFTWEKFLTGSTGKDGTESIIQPSSRAGHSAVVWMTKIYYWSGRDLTRNFGEKAVCFNDLLMLETGKPRGQAKISLNSSGKKGLEVNWTPVEGANSYVLQCSRYDVPPSRPLQFYKQDNMKASLISYLKFT